MKYSLVQDNTANLYVVPSELVEDWYEFVDELEGCATPVPPYAQPLNWSTLTFDDYRIV